MSETLTTTTIDRIEAPQRESSISLADLLAGIGMLAYHGTRLAVKGTVLGTKLAYKGIKAGADAVKANRLRNDEIERMAMGSASAGDALTSLASTSGFELLARDAAPLRSRIQTLVATNDRLGVATLARELRNASQQRLQANLKQLTTEACRMIGFEVVTLRAHSGILTAQSNQAPGRLDIQYVSDDQGGVKLHIDAEGFHGGACVARIDALLEHLSKSGVRFGVVRRQRNDRSPAFDGRSILQTSRLHCRG
jgi:hypothetical protein